MNGKTMKPDELAPSRARSLEHLRFVVARLGSMEGLGDIDRQHRLHHRFVYSAVYENKLTPAEAAEWNDRIDRRYEEVTGQPAPPRPPDPFAEEA